MSSTALASDLTVELKDLPSFFEASPLTLTVRACNQGSTYAPSSRTEIRLSTDTQFDPSDTYIGDAWIDGLEPGQCRNFYASAYVSSAPGPVVHPLALADADGSVMESDESNNLFVGPLTGAGAGADLVVAEVHAPAYFGPTTQIAVDVCNLGPDPMGWFDVEVLASTDAVIQSPAQGPSPDVPLGWQSAGSLGGHRCATLWVPVNPAFPLGTDAGFIGAAIQATPQVRTDNDTGVAAYRTAFTSGFQLQPTRVEAHVDAQGQLQVSTTLCNRGDTPSYPAPELWLSSDDQLDRSGPQPDLLLPYSGGFTALPGGRCVSSEDALGAPMLPGPFHVIFVAEQPGDLIPEDDVLVSAPVFPGRPNLVVETVSKRWQASSSGFIVEAKICNTGDQPSWPLMADVLTSYDEELEAPQMGNYYEDYRIDGIFVPDLQPGACSTVGSAPVQLMAPYMGAPMALYAGWVGVRVDADDWLQETSEDDNAAVLATGFGSGPDLRVASVSVGLDDAATGSRRADVEVCNDGDQPSGIASIEWVLSFDRWVEDPREGPIYEDLSLPGLYGLSDVMPGQCRHFEGPIGSLPPPPSPEQGDAWLGALVLASGPDIDSRNDRGVSSPFLAAYDHDLAVVGLERRTVYDGNQFMVEIEATICNQGFQPAYGAPVDIVTSADQEVEAFEVHGSYGYFADVPVAQLNLQGMLEPGDCARPSTRVPDLQPPATAFPGPNPSPTYLGARVLDAGWTRSVAAASNDTLLIGPVPVGYDANAKVESGDFHFDVASATWTYSARVCNDGLQDAFGFEAQFLASEDDELEGAWSGNGQDQFLGSVQVYHLPIGRCVDLEIIGPPPMLPTGTAKLGRLGVVLLPGSPDANPADNQAVVSRRLPLVPESDLAVTRFARQLDPSAPDLRFDVEVCNRGLTPSGPTDVELAYSEDRALDAQDQFSPGSHLPPLDPGACTELQLSAPFPWYPTTHAAAVVDRLQGQADLDRSNDVSAWVTLSMSGPDVRLVKAERLGFHSNGYDVRYQLRACNYGFMTSGGTDIEALTSADDWFSPSPASNADLIASSAWLPSLDPSRCADIEMVVPAIPSANPEGDHLAFRIRPGSPDGDSLIRAGRIGPVLENLSVLGVQSRLDTTQGPAEWVFDVEVCATGMGGAAGFDLDLLLTVDDEVEPAYSGQYFQDQLLISLPGGYLAAGACQTLSYRSGWLPQPPPIQSPPPDPVRVGRIAARLRAHGPDAVRDDDVALSEPLVIDGGADLAVRSFTETTVLVNGTPMKRIDVLVCNDGLGAALAFDAELSVVGDAGAFPLAPLSFSGLNPNACQRRRYTGGWLPSAGASSEAELRVVLDPQRFNDDANPANDRSSLAPVGTGPEADLRINWVRVQYLTTELKVIAQVCNRGFTPTQGGDVEFWASANAELDPTRDLFLQGATLPALDPGRCTNIGRRIGQPRPHDDLGQPVDEGYFLVELDPSNVVPESVESNNAGVSARASLTP